MNASYLKLIQESALYDLTIINEQENVHAPKKVKFKGPYAVAEAVNANRRKYPESILDEAVRAYTREFISTSRAVGELNHSDRADVDYNNACHKIIGMEKDGKQWIGESQVLLGTPKGDLLAGLLNNSVKVGVSTRGVGSIMKDNNTVNVYKLITVDVVYDPSAPGAFVDGILESKNYMINTHGDVIEVAYNNLNENIAFLPKKDINDVLINSINLFLNSF